MSEQFNLGLALSDPTRVWSLRTAELPFTNGNKEPDYHCFLTLVEEGPCPGIIDELHFVPIDRDMGRGQSNPTRDTAPPILGAIAYTRAKRNFLNLATIQYDHGTPEHMLHLWNSASRAALEISDLKRPFERGDCRAGAKATLESIGYQFQTFTDIQMQWGMNTDLAKRINNHSSDPKPDISALLTDFRALHEKLDAPRVG